MRRRSKAVSLKSRGRKPAAPKRGSGTGTARRRAPSAASHESEATRLASELSAMGEILRLISDSPSNVTAVLQSVAEQAAQICQAQYVDIFIVENDNLRNLAWFGKIKRTLAFPLDRSQKRHAEPRPYSSVRWVPCQSMLPVRMDVRALDDPPLDRYSPYHGAAIAGESHVPRQGVQLGKMGEARRRTIHLALAGRDLRHLGAAQTRGRFDERV